MPNGLGINNVAGIELARSMCWEESWGRSTGNLPGLTGSTGPSYLKLRDLGIRRRTKIDN